MHASLLNESLAESLQAQTSQTPMLQVPTSPVPTLHVKTLGLTDYTTTWHAMQAFTAARDDNTPDELWITEHPPVYTMGLNRKDVRLPMRHDIPLVNIDRGGKITYHGPGQLIVYCLIDLKRLSLSVRQLVSAMEHALIALLAEDGIQAEAQANAPGVYVNGEKIASLGLRLKNMRSYHGLSLNVAMDLCPFDAIDPCGYQGLKVTQLSQLAGNTNMDILAQKLVKYLSKSLGYSHD